LSGVLKKLFERIASAFAADDPEAAAADRKAALRLATAVLMVDVARVDSAFSELEFDQVVTLAARRFGLDAEAAAALAEQADEKAEALVSLHELTTLLHAELDDDEKIEVVRMLWHVAYCDQHLDKYEDALILKIGDLLHVGRGTVMRLKSDAQSLSAPE
jgi:uncharacterized tellurite resistance protein B-like protein